MKKICFALVAFIICASCQKKLAHFNSSSFEEFSEKTNARTSETPIILEKKLLIREIVVAKDVEIKDIKTTPENTKKLSKPQSKPNQAVENNILDLEKKTFEEKNEDTKIKKKKRKKNPVFNDGVKIGIVFLGIAILLAILSLNSLSLLFGVVSAIFFIIGLKKYMRKKRLRELFKF